MLECVARGLLCTWEAKNPFAQAFRLQKADFPGSEAPAITNCCRCRPQDAVNPVPSLRQEVMPAGPYLKNVVRVNPSSHAIRTRKSPHYQFCVRFQQSQKRYPCFVLCIADKLLEN